MRKKVYPVTIALTALTGIALFGLSFIRHELDWAILGALMLILAIAINIYGGVQRLLSDWPPGIIWRSGWDARDRAGRTYRRRRNLDIVRPDDEAR